MSAAIFDKISPVYESPGNRAFYRDTTGRMTANAPRFENRAFRASCLDLACGTGISTETARTVAPEADWYGVDQSLGMLRQAEAKPSLRGVRFIHCAAEQTPFPDGKFDWILCNIAYHWLPRSMPREIQRLLKPAGRLSMMVPLLAPAGTENGNFWLGCLLMRFSRMITARRSQGLTLPALEAELRDFHLDRAEIVDIDEEFTSFRELLDALASRSSLQAIFGEHAGEVRNLLAGEDHSAPLLVRFRWKVAIVEARKK